MTSKEFAQMLVFETFLSFPPASSLIELVRANPLVAPAGLSRVCCLRDGKSHGQLHSRELAVSWLK